jgi:hypothetical protein
MKLKEMTSEFSGLLLESGWLFCDFRYFCVTLKNLCYLCFLCDLYHLCAR